MTIAQTVNTPRTSAQRAAVEELQLANNGVTHAQSVSRANAKAVYELVTLGVVKKTTALLYGFGLVSAFELASTTPP